MRETVTSRRDFIRATALAGGGLMISVALPGRSAFGRALGAAAADPFAPSAWIRIDASGQKLGYGELAALAGAIPVPKEPRLKDPKDFRLIGTRVPRLDIPAKVNGSAVFGIDVKVPGALVAVVKRPPVFGATAGAV